MSELLSESPRADAAKLGPCPECGAAAGTPHASGCDVELCSVCGGQRLQCLCEAHDSWASRWTGEWPGKAECRTRGWWCRMTGAGPRPCAEGEPGATEDLNRLAFFVGEGWDGVYGGN